MGAGSEFRDNPRGDAGYGFQFQGMAAGLREQVPPVHEQALIAVPAEDPVTVPRAAGKTGGRWLIGALSGALLMLGAVWLSIPWLSRLLVVRPELSVQRELSGPSVELAPAPPHHAMVPVSSPPVLAVKPPETGADTGDVSSVGPLQQGATRSQHERRTDHRRPEKAVTTSVSEVSLESAPSTQTLTSIDIRAAIDPLRGRLRECHASVQRGGQVVRGRMEVELELSGPKVQFVDIRSRVGPISLQSCIRNVLYTARFKGVSGQEYSKVRCTLRIGRPG